MTSYLAASLLAQVVTKKDTSLPIFDSADPFLLIGFAADVIGGSNLVYIYIYIY